MAGYKGFKFGDASYTADAVWFEKQSISAYRAEYARLYQVAQKRLKSFEKAGRTEGQEYRYAKQYIKPLRQIKTERDLGYSISDIHKFLSSPTGSLSGLRASEKKIAKALRENWGFTSITPDKIADFGQYMDYLRQRGLDKEYGSGRLAELYAEAAARKLDPMEIARREDDFYYFLVNLDAFSKSPRHRKAKYQNLDTYRKDIEKIRRKQGY